MIRSLLPALLAAVLAVSVVSGTASPASAASAASPAPAATTAAVGSAGETPVFERFALRSPRVERSAFRVVLVRRGSGERVRGATVRFEGTSAGRTFRAAGDTNARGVARWALPRRSARFRYLEATFRPRPSDTTSVQLGLCRRDGGGWRECGSGRVSPRP